MTLALTIVSRHGIWQSSDMRLYDANAGKPLPDPSVKQFRPMFFNEDVALVACAGIGHVDSSHVCDKMVNLLRGQPRTFGQTLDALVAFANDHHSRSGLVGYTRWYDLQSRSEGSGGHPQVNA